MSQIYKSSASGPPPPAVPTTFVTDVNSPAIPALNILNVITGVTSDNTDNGIETDGSSGGNTLTIYNTNTVQGSVTTNNAALTTISTFALGATPSVFNITGYISAFAPATGDGATYDYNAGIKTDGATATVIGTSYENEFEDASFVTADIFVNVSGNNIVIQVQGVAATTINWKNQFKYIVVS